jgi:hypothetical protein
LSTNHLKREAWLEKKITNVVGMHKRKR